MRQGRHQELSATLGDGARRLRRYAGGDKSAKCTGSDCFALGRSAGYVRGPSNFTRRAGEDFVECSVRSLLEVFHEAGTRNRKQDHHR